ncbi:hypothetical protein [Halorussus caseinilyticus]|uniref:hypothetical protein n=1 Tax=Halorussus caseinilyticus TaxID=3034025 RepID=UPI0023E8AB38|nr:hypothetical protein [Halorussus sp. DT72]
MWVSPKTLLLLCCLLTASVVGGATPRETAARDKFPSECLDAPEVRPGETVGQVNSAMDIDVFQIPVTKGDVIEVNATVSAENATVKIDHEAAFSDAVVDVKNPSNDSLTDSPWSNWVELDHAGGSWNVVVEKSGFFCVELSRELDANTSAETPYDWSYAYEKRARGTNRSVPANRTATAGPGGVVDADGDGVPDDEDWAPRNPGIQNRSDVYTTERSTGVPGFTPAVTLAAFTAALVVGVVRGRW